ncbi:MAG: ATP-binding cassette domain-containing protein [Gammaproteobacteria bacterium]|nr:ATP-binding cassette domain-containing protein [Gammaproteobacteria bacterium]
MGLSLLRLHEPTGGEVIFEGKDLLKLSDAERQHMRRRIQVVFQNPYASLNPRFTIGQTLVEPMEIHGVGQDMADREQRARSLLEKVGLDGRAFGKYPHEFSGGQRQRIAIARCLTLNPDVLVLDEAVSALDVSVQAQVLNLLKSLQREHGLAYLFITHDISVVSYLAHRVAVMYLGRIVEQGSVDEVLESPSHPYTQALLSAVPRIESEAGRKVIVLQGDMPSPANPPQGCHFHPRCSRAVAACRSAYPQEVHISASHSARCIRLSEA